MLSELLNKVICGDALEALKGLPDDSVDCVVTSPPYNKGNKKGGENWSNSGINYEVFDDDMAGGRLPK